MRAWLGKLPAVAALLGFGQTGLAQPCMLRGIVVDRGRFRFSNLAPGAYYLSAEAGDSGDAQSITHDSDGNPLTAGYVETYFPGVAGLDAAKSMVLEAGHDITGITLQLLEANRALRRIAGRVTPPARGEVKATGPDASGRKSTISIAVLPDGSFQRSGLLAGRYVLTFDAAGQAGRMEVDLAAADATDLMLATHPVKRFAVPLVMRTEGGGAAFQPTNSFWIALARKPDGQLAEFAHRAGNGGFEFRDVEPQIYTLWISDRQEGYYVKEVRFAGRTIADEIDFSRGAAGPVEVVYSTRVAQLEGRVTGQASGLVRVVATRLNARERERVRVAIADQDGRFEMGSLAPGKYRIWAVEDSADDERENEAAAKEERGVLVEVGEGERKRIEVSLTPAQ